MRNLPAITERSAMGCNSSCISRSYGEEEPMSCSCPIFPAIAPHNLLHGPLYQISIMSTRVHISPILNDKSSHPSPNVLIFQNHNRKLSYPRTDSRASAVIITHPHPSHSSAIRVPCLATHHSGPSRLCQRYL